MARSQKSSRALLRLLKSSSTPMYVLDAQRAILFTNTACAEWLGVDEEALVGRVCNYHDGAAASNATGDREELLAARLCPPPDVFAGRSLTTEVHLPASSPTSASTDGPTSRHVMFIPLGDDASAAVLAVASDAASSNAADAWKATTTATANGDDGRESRDLHQQLLHLRHEYGLDRAIDRLVGESVAARRMRDQLQVACASLVRTVLVGAAGSGAETLAHNLHHRRAAPRGRLVPLACPLLDAELLQGAVTELKRPASYRAGQPSGTLLLLEVEQLSPSAQDELAGFLALPGFELHTLATSSESLLARAAAGTFRRDLAYALSTLEIALTPLRERPEDLPLLAQQLLEAGNAQGGAQFAGFTPEAFDLLASYNWPGDVDELAGMIEQTRTAGTPPLLDAGDLPQRLHLAEQAAAYPAKKDEPIDLDKLLAEIEGELIERALKRAKGNKSKAAELLGVTRARLHRRLAQSEGDAAPTETVEQTVESGLQPDFREIEDDDA